MHLLRAMESGNRNLMAIALAVAFTTDRAWGEKLATTEVQGARAAASVPARGPHIRLSWKKDVLTLESPRFHNTRIRRSSPSVRTGDFGLGMAGWRLLTN